MIAREESDTDDGFFAGQQRGQRFVSMDITIHCPQKMGGLSTPLCPLYKKKSRVFVSDYNVGRSEVKLRTPP